MPLVIMLPPPVAIARVYGAQSHPPPVRTTLGGMQQMPAMIVRLTACHEAAHGVDGVIKDHR